MGLVEDTLRRYSRTSCQGKVTTWVPPTLEDVSECARAHPYSLNEAYFDKTVGEVRQNYKEPQRVELDADEYQKVEAELISALFSANGYTTHLIKTQELMLGEFSPVDFYFEPVPIKNALPEPPVDIRAPLVCIYTLLTSHTRFEHDVLPVLVAPRVCQLVEAAFWLTHCVVFADQKTSVKCSQLLEMRGQSKKTLLEEQGKAADDLPDYLNVLAADLTSQEYLANRLAHAYTLILKQWAGAQGRIKTFVEEFLPYYVARCVHIAFLRVFPQYAHVFSQ